MAEDLNQIGVLRRREIEARMVGPLLDAFAAEIGRDRAEAIVRETITKIAAEQGGELARQGGDATPAGLLRALEPWTRDGSLELKVLRQSDTELAFDVTRCKYAEMYRAMGRAELGAILSCSRDFALCSGFNPQMHLTRTQTIMQGASHCDFRFKVEEDSTTATRRDGEESEEGEGKI